jgi:hypothetical protein
MEFRTRGLEGRMGDEGGSRKKEIIVHISIEI